MPLFACLGYWSILRWALSLVVFQMNHGSIIILFKSRFYFGFADFLLILFHQLNNCPENLFLHWLHWMYLWFWTPLVIGQLWGTQTPFDFVLSHMKQIVDCSVIFYRFLLWLCSWQSHGHPLGHMSWNPTLHQIDFLTVSPTSSLRLWSRLDFSLGYLLLSSVISLIYSSKATLGSTS